MPRARTDVQVTDERRHRGGFGTDVRRGHGPGPTEGVLTVKTLASVGRLPES